VTDKLKDGQHNEGIIAQLFKETSMIKAIVLDRRKPGMSLKEFREYYETVHAPLYLSLIPKIATYRRNYLTPVQSADDMENWNFSTQHYDCMVEMTWHSQADYEEAMAFLLSDAATPLAEDEENFLDRSSMTVFMADPVNSAI
jgi:uncharacterized protein (TIGR02118 family)